MILFHFIRSHLKLFLGIPCLLFFIFCLYAGYIFVSWQNDRPDAMNRLAKYKQLIDRTEEMRKGLVYSQNDISISAGAVDLPTRIYDRNDNIIGEFFEQKREIVPYDFIPQWIVKGVVASEDRKFYEHDGINYMGILRAMLVNVVSLRAAQGGSTITQQLAKVLFTDSERSIKRKVYEAFCAREIEKVYDKQDILSMYLNLIYFGNGVYGVESASRMFFGKSVKECDVAECAMIVAVISSPRSYSPLMNPENSLRKTKRILVSMKDAGFLSGKQADTAYKMFLENWKFKFDENGKPAGSLVGSFIMSKYRVNRAPFFNEKIRRRMVELFGEDALKKGGLSIYTTIDAEKQDAAMAALKAGIQSQRNYHLNNAKKIKNSEKAAEEAEKAQNIEGAFVVMNPFTGEIICYAGGYEFSAGNQIDNASQILRQPGSSFKPFIYAAAVQDRVVSPSTVFTDEPTVFKGGYSPKNSSLTYAGNMTVREALRRSVNVVAVKVLDKCGYDTVFGIIKNGLDLSGSEMKKRFGKTLSLALGTYEVSPLENCMLHSVIAGGGEYVKPWGIRCVKDYSGNIIYNPGRDAAEEIKEKREKKGKIIDPETCAVVISMMKGVFEKGGTGFRAVENRNIPFEIAGKTGTSTNYNDAWFVGYTPELVSTVWIGNKKGAVSLGRGRSGGNVSAPVWADFISKTASENDKNKFDLPDKGVSVETVCAESGKVADDSCPVTAEQVYIEGTEPGEFCSIHGKEKKQH